jgi:arylsulfatase
MVPAQAYVGEHLQSYAAFPPRQKPGSFNLDEVMKKLTSASSSGKH